MKYRTITLNSTKLIKKHLKVLNDLDHQCFPSDHRYPKIRGEKYGHEGYHVWWLTYDVDTKKPIAFAGIKVYTKTNNVYFCRVGVIEECRGNQIHSKLLKKRFDWCRDNDIFYAYTYTSADNYISINNLVKSGFKICEPWFVVSEWVDILFFCKKIKRKCT